MAEITAKSKYACPNCGAEAVWNAAKQALVCSYCGTISPAKLSTDGSGIEEHDLVAALRDAGDSQRGWDAQRVSVKCQSCQAISVFPPDRVAQRCEFCGSASLVPYEQIKAPIRPESLLPFKISESQVRDAIHEWTRSRWFAPDRFKNAARTDTLHGVYIPYWTFDAQVHAEWSAESGYHYTDTEWFTDSDGQQKTREVQRTRWEPSAGNVDHFFDDELVPASRGTAPEMLRKIEPFPTTQELMPYDAGYLAGWVVEQYQIDLAEAAERSHSLMQAEIERMCAQEVPGDTHRNLQVEADFSAQTFKHVLVPIWLLTYTYGAQSFPVIVNGYTGSIAGRYPKSWLKIGLLVLAILVVVIIVLSFSNH
ncbi:MAG: zinc ribbon domain-containing protein [Chthoniobacteraceae bacterium]